jgi:hypothetical protein
MNHTPYCDCIACNTEHTDHNQAEQQTHAAPHLHGGQAVVGFNDSGDEQTRALFADLAFSGADWLRILNAHNGLPSEQRAMFGTRAIQQAKRLGINVTDNGCEPEDSALGRRLDELPLAGQLGVLDVIERFWTGSLQGETFGETMNVIGVRICENAREG